jgi:hypothetical protein
MATSPNFSWPEPDNTDLVKNGALAIRTAVNAIDTSMAELKGGTTGQVLSKTSATDMDFTWVTTDDANAIQNAIVDAKGDLIAATANDTPARLAVGANGETLIADSTQSTGLKWAKSTTFAGASVYNSTTQSVPNNTATAITFSAELFDTNTFHSTSTNTSRMTIPTGYGGTYRVSCNALFDTNAVGFRQLRLFKNGAAYFFSPEVAGSATVYVGVTITYTLQLVAGDYIEMFALQNSGGNLNVFTRDIDNPLTIEFLGV